ncbi:MAG: hypothetical protein Q8L98_04715 [Chlamydiales bacterium]|nr:hypothetical protein [Chlamydiales bacterium]
MRYKKAVFFSSFLLSASLLSLYFFMIAVKPDDIAEYVELMQNSQNFRSQNSLASQDAVQLRQQVQKDIWTRESHIQLKSLKSTLSLSKKDRSLYAKETFHEVFGIIEKEDQPTCHFTMDEGYYCFPSEKLIGKNLHLSIEGTCLIQADEAEITDLHEPFQLQGNIHFSSLPEQEGSIYALADSASYYPKTRILILNGSKEKNVLCYQDAHTFSAPQLHIHEDTKTIEAKGDVRFSFTVEEKTSFEHIFSKYL